MVKKLFEAYKGIMQMEDALNELQIKLEKKTKAFNEVASLLTETERMEFTRLLIDYLKEESNK